MTELMKYEGGTAVLADEAIQRIRALEQSAKEIKEKQDELKKALIEQCEKYGVKQIKNDFMTISYTPEHVTERFDSTALKNQSPALYEAYSKEVKTKASVRITLAKVNA